MVFVMSCGRSGGVLGALWGVLRPFGAFGGALEHLVGVVGVSESILDVFFRLFLNHFRSFLGHFWGIKCQALPSLAKHC